MRKLLVLISLLLTVPAVAKSPKAEDSGKEKLSTKFSFDDFLVQGRYRKAGELVTVVEKEKKLEYLIGVRIHFKDKIKQTMERR